MRWIAVLVFSLFGPLAGSGILLAQGPGSANVAQVREQSILQTAGYPLIDPDQRLTPAARAALLEELDALAACCGLSLVLVLQEESVTGNAQDDLRALTAQIRRASWWGEGSLILLLQSDPALVLVARAPGLAERTAVLSPERLDLLTAELARSSPESVLLPVLQTLGQSPSESPSSGRSALFLESDLFGRVSPRVLAALLHAGVLMLLYTLLAFFLRLTWSAPEALPKRLIRLQVPHLPDLPEVRVPPALLWVQQTRRRRHRGWALTLAFACSLAGLIALEPAFGLGLAWHPLPFPEQWIWRALITVFMGVLSYGVLAATPLGAWLTPRPLRRKILAASLARLDNVSALILVYQPFAKVLEVWLPARAPLSAEVFKAILDRADQDSRHGASQAALLALIAQIDRVAQMRGMTALNAPEPFPQVRL